MRGRGAIREVRSWPQPAPAQPILDAVLVVSGEIGYANTSVQEVLRRSGAPRSRFYRHFDSKDDCFARAYEMAADRLCEEVLGAACSCGGWREGFRAGLAALFAFTVEQPAMAKALLIEGRYAEGAAQVKHMEVFERLSHAVESAGRETDTSRHSPPPMTGTLMVSAIEHAVCRRLARGEERKLWQIYPDLVHFVVLPYFGEDAAWEGFDTATAEIAGRTSPQTA